MVNYAVWGVHMGAHVSDRPIEGGYIAIGWPNLGDLSAIETTRDAFKKHLALTYPNKKPGAIPVDAGTLFKFVHELKAGDIVIYPSKGDRMVNIGRLKGKLRHDIDDRDKYPNKKDFQWLGHFPRDEFSQSALNEIGSFLTLFRVRRHVAEFLRKIDPTAVKDAEEAAQQFSDQLEENTDDETATGAAGALAETNARDFVIRRLNNHLSGHDFELFVAHLMECMGYQARVTSKSGDGGVDVIAHMDPLGFQPPIVKVQCKRTTGQTQRPEVDRLLGTLGDGEYGLFINLGSFTRGAIELERNRAKLRLLDGDQVVDLIFEHYGKLSPKFRALLPLKQIFVPDYGPVDC